LDLVERFLQKPVSACRVRAVHRPHELSSPSRSEVRDLWIIDVPRDARHRLDERRLREPLGRSGLLLGDRGADAGDLLAVANERERLLAFRFLALDVTFFTLLPRDRRKESTPALVDCPAPRCAESLAGDFELDPGLVVLERRQELREVAPRDEVVDLALGGREVRAQGSDDRRDDGVVRGHLLVVPGSRAA